MAAVLQVVMLDTFRTRMAIVNEGEHIPYTRRLVSIELTEEQRKQLELRVLGTDCGRTVHEEIGAVWLECPGLTEAANAGGEEGGRDG